jgi:signal transduction histidine kinase
VTQEATANVAHHANAHAMTVRLTFNGDILLQVSDDGQGFDPQHVAREGHFGLAGMRERAALVGGTLNVTSQPRAGTIVELKVEDFIK